MEARYLTAAFPSVNVAVGLSTCQFGIHRNLGMNAAACHKLFVSIRPTSGSEYIPAEGSPSLTVVHRILEVSADKYRNTSRHPSSTTVI